MHTHTPTNQHQRKLTKSISFRQSNSFIHHLQKNHFHSDQNTQKTVHWIECCYVIRAQLVRDFKVEYVKKKHLKGF